MLAQSSGIIYRYIKIMETLLGTNHEYVEDDDDDCPGV
jgi:hypothetical protein